MAEQITEYATYAASAAEDLIAGASTTLGDLASGVSQSASVMLSEGAEALTHAGTAIYTTSSDVVNDYGVYLAGAGLSAIGISYLLGGQRKNVDQVPVSRPRRARASSSIAATTPTPKKRGRPSTATKAEADSSAAQAPASPKPRGRTASTKATPASPKPRGRPPGSANKAAKDDDTKTPQTNTVRKSSSTGAARKTTAKDTDTAASTGVKRKSTGATVPPPVTPSKLTKEYLQGLSLMGRPGERGINDYLKERKLVTTGTKAEKIDRLLQAL